MQIQTQVRDPVAVGAACQRLGLAAQVYGAHKLFGTEEVSGVAVQLSDWRYPVVCDTTLGQLQFDNFNGHWGDLKQLDRFLQAYAAEKVHLEARRQGHSVTEQFLADGSIKLTVQVTGGAA